MGAQEKREGALAGFRVLDLTHYIAGPYCTRLLSGLGAEVIKVEKPGEGDGARRVGPFLHDDVHPEKSGLFLHLNAGKKSITLNLKTSAGKEIFKELAKSADAVIENFEPRVMPSLGLDYPALIQLNQGIVMTSISNFGQTGPYRDYKATELTEYAMSGLMYITGEPEREPLKLGVNMAQYVAGQLALVPTLAALYARETTGVGKHIDVSIMEACAGLLEFQAAQYDYTGWVPKRIGNINEKGHPWGLYPCRDGYVALASRFGKWPLMAKLMEKPELKDPRFDDSFGRIQHRDEIDAIMLPWLVEHDKEEIYHTAQRLGVVAGWVRDMKDVANSAQLKARDFFVSVEHPATGALVYPGAPYSMSGTPFQTGRAPFLGEHNEEIYLSYLGYDKQELVRLRGQGII